MTEVIAPKISLITLSYQSAAYIERCLSALVHQGQWAEVIHADNGSDDLDLAALKAKFPVVRLVPFGENLGFAAAMNRAAKLANADWLGFVNPDAFLDDDWLNAMRAAIKAHPQTAIFTSLQLDDGDPSRLDGAGDGMSFFGFPYRMGFGHPAPERMDTVEVFSPCGAAFIIRRDLFEALDGFDEHFFCYCEDADLGFRARLLGEACLLAPHAIVRHIGSATLGKRSDFALRCGTRNRLWLYIKNMPLGLLIATLPLHVGLSFAILLKDILRGQGKAVMTAFAEGLRGLPFVWSQRREIQRNRKISALRLAKVLTWNPVTIARRALTHRRPT